MSIFIINLGTSVFGLQTSCWQRRRRRRTPSWLRQRTCYMSLLPAILHCDLHATYGLSCSAPHSTLCWTCARVPRTELALPWYCLSAACRLLPAACRLPPAAATWLSEINLEVSALLQVISGAQLRRSYCWATLRFPIPIPFPSFSFLSC